MLFAVVVVVEVEVRVGNWETHCHFQLGESVHCLHLLTGLNITLKSRVRIGIDCTVWVSELYWGLRRSIVRRGVSAAAAPAGFAIVQFCAVELL